METIEAVSDEVVVVSQLPEVASLSLSGHGLHRRCPHGERKWHGPEGEPVTLSYVYIDGVQSSETGSTLDGGTHFDKGQEVYVVVIPNDGIDDGNPETSSTVTIANTLPVASTPTLAPDPAYEADTLTCTPGTSSDADGDSVSLSYGWSTNRWRRPHGGHRRPIGLASGTDRTSRSPPMAKIPAPSKPLWR